MPWPSPSRCGRNARTEKFLLVMMRHPLRQDRPAAADDAGDALGKPADVLAPAVPRMHREVVDPLLGLLFNHFQVDIDVQVFQLLDANDSAPHKSHRPNCTGECRRIASRIE